MQNLKAWVSSFPALVGGVTDYTIIDGQKRPVNSPSPATRVIHQLQSKCFTCHARY